MCFADWKNLGLTSEPNTGDNAVHASAAAEQHAELAVLGDGILPLAVARLVLACS